MSSFRRGLKIVMHTKLRLLNQNSEWCWTVSTVLNQPAEGSEIQVSMSTETLGSADLDVLKYYRKELKKRFPKF